MGESTPRPFIHGETQTSVVKIVNDHFGPMLMGRSIADRNGYMELLDTVAGNPTAKGALDIAIHDALARDLNITLAELLGGAPDPVRISFMVALGSVDEMLSEVQKVRELTGISAFKLKGGREPKLDIARVVALRELLGDDGFIFVDANQLYSPHVAIEVLNEMANYGLAMAEEPVAWESNHQRRRVADAIRVPILADDSVTNLIDTQRELISGAVGVVGIKPPRTGIMKSKSIASAAAVFGLPCWIGSQGVSGLGTLASAHFAAGAGIRTYPADLGNFLKQSNMEDLLDIPVDVREGAIHLPAGSGTGASISDDKLEHYRSDR